MTFPDLTPHMCHWPNPVTTERGAVDWCGAECVEGRSYCAEHLARAIYKTVAAWDGKRLDWNVRKLTGVGL